MLSTNSLPNDGDLSSKIDDRSDSNDSKVLKVWNFTKRYGQHLIAIAMEVGIPLVLLATVSVASDVRDPERFGLGWLHWTRLGSDLERETIYPSHEPSSKAQKNRMGAARAVESLTLTE